MYPSIELVGLSAEQKSNVASKVCYINSATVVQEFYAQKGPFTKQIATEGFSTVFGQLMSPL